MATASDLIRVAQSQVGYSRWDDPEQGTKYGRWYASITGSPYFGTNGVAYCAMFVSWCLDHANVQCEGFPRAVAIDRRDGFNRMVEPCDLQPGDVVGFDWDSDKTGDHVGIVVARVGDMVTIRTIEGNTSGGRVAECERNVGQCTIGVRPYFDESSSPAKEAGRLDVDGICGPNTVSYWQEQVGTPVDGSIWDQPADNDRWRRNVWAVEHGRGNEGSALVRAVQWTLASKGYDLGPDGIDGIWGYYFSSALQCHLKKMGYYGGDIDHDFAQHSVRALQRSLNDRRWMA